MANSNQTKKNGLTRRTAQIFLPLVVAAICLYYIADGFRWSEIWQTLREINLPLFLTSSILTTLIFWLLRSLRWAVLLENEKLDIAFFKLYLYTATTVGFANFTPFQSGEALKVELLRKYGGERFSGYNYFFFEKLLDLLVIATLAAFGVFVVFKFEIAAHLQSAIGVIIAVSAVLIIGFAVVALKKFPEKMQNLRRGAAARANNLWSAFFLTAASWTVMIFGWKFIFQSAAIDLTIAQTTAIIALTTVIGILSFVPGAIGVSEISIAALLSHLGYEVVAAQTGAIMIALYSLIILILAVVHLIILKAANHDQQKKI